MASSSAAATKLPASTTAAKTRISWYLSMVVDATMNPPAP
jgi:hypothetical protein